MKNKEHISHTELTVRHCLIIQLQTWPSCLSFSVTANLFPLWSFLGISLHVCTFQYLCPYNTANTTMQENKCCLSSLQLCQQWYLIQTGGSESFVAGWGGRIKTLCLNEALVQLGSPLEHHTCIFLSNFLSGKVRESWTGGDVRKSQESIRSDWKCLLELHHCTLFRHDPSPTEMQVHTWTLALSIEHSNKQSTCDFSGFIKTVQRAGWSI